jgi:hypothetical protein
MPHRNDCSYVREDHRSTQATHDWAPWGSGWPAEQTSLYLQVAHSHGMCTWDLSWVDSWIHHSHSHRTQKTTPHQTPAINIHPGICLETVSDFSLLYLYLAKALKLEWSRSEGTGKVHTMTISPWDMKQNFINWVSFSGIAQDCVLHAMINIYIGSFSSSKVIFNPLWEHVCRIGYACFCCWFLVAWTSSS